MVVLYCFVNFWPKKKVAFLSNFFLTAPRLGKVKSQNKEGQGQKTNKQKWQKLKLRKKKYELWKEIKEVVFFCSIMMKERNKKKTPLLKKQKFDANSKD
jgi:hypothetical protein